MQWLEALVAFSVVMMFLSTMVLVIVETIHHLAKLRQDGLRRQVAHLYDDIIKPSIQNKADLISNTSEQFSQQLTSVRYQPISPNSWWITKFFRSSLESDKSLKSLTALEFIERFAETPAGNSLFKESKRRGSDVLKIQIDNLVSKYEEYGQHTGQYFAKRAHLFSIGISILLAFILNLHAYDILKTFVEDKDLRTSVIAQGDTASVQLQAQLASMEQQLMAVEPNNKTPEEALNEIKQDIKALKGLNDNLHATGIPVGWKTVPLTSDFFDAINNRKCWVSPDIPRTGKVEKTLCNIAFSAQWLISVVFMGLLVGLGGPFWFNAYKKLLSFTGMGKDLQSTVQKSKENVGKIDQRIEPTDIFEKAMAAYLLNKPKEQERSSDQEAP